MAAKPSPSPPSLCRLETTLIPNDRSTSTTSTPLTPASLLSVPSPTKQTNNTTMSRSIRAASPDSLWERRSQMSSSHSAQAFGLVFTNPASPVDMPWAPESWPQSPSQHRFALRKKSVVELNQQEEQQQVSPNLLGLIEPRPVTGVAVGGIEEVLHGQA